MLRNLVGLLQGVSAILVWAELAAAPPPTFTPFGVPDLVPSDMSADGSRVVGQSFFAFGPNFLWTRDAGLVALGGGCPSGKVSISGDGTTIVGCATNSAGLWEAARWLGGTSWVGLGSVPGADPCDSYLSGPEGLDQDGSHMAGEAWSAVRCRSHAGLWNLSTGELSDLGPYGTDQSGYPRAISRNGRVIVGSAYLGRLVAARWSDGEFETLQDGHGRDLGQANSTNADGSVIVGVGYPGTGAAWRWKDGEGVIPLGPGVSVPDPDVDWISWAEDVSDDGSVVVGTTSFLRGWIWREKKGFDWLDDFLAREKAVGAEGWKIRSVEAVSADGTVFAGTGTNPQGTFEGFVVTTRAH